MNIQDDEEVESFSDWMSFIDFATECNMSKIRMFIKWMATKLTNDDLKLHDDLLTSLTREQFNNFKHEDMKNMHIMSTPSHFEPHTSMTTFTGHMKSSATSESLTALNNFKRGTKRDASAYPIFKNDLYYDSFQRSFLAIIKSLMTL